MRTDGRDVLQNVLCIFCNNLFAEAAFPAMASKRNYLPDGARSGRWRSHSARAGATILMRATHAPTRDVTEMQRISNGRPIMPVERENGKISQETNVESFLCLFAQSAFLSLFAHFYYFACSLYSDLFTRQITLRYFKASQIDEIAPLGSLKLALISWR